MSVLSEVGPFGGHFSFWQVIDMIEQMWKRQEINLKGKITRLANKMKSADMLSDKLEINRQVKEAREALKQHRLNFFEMTSSN